MGNDHSGPWKYLKDGLIPDLPKNGIEGLGNKIVSHLDRSNIDRSIGTERRMLKLYLTTVTLPL